MSQSASATRHGTGWKNRFHIQTMAALVRTKSAIVSSVIAPSIVLRSMRTIALMTDFGTRDPYVAAMKGVIASRCEAHRQECLCHILDLTHDIAPFDVWEAAFFLRDVARYWPAETIFVCVVDRVPLDYTPGAIIRIDRFGNCITDLMPTATPFALIVNDYRISDIRTNYSGDGAFLIIGSTGCIEISIAGGSAASLLHLSRGDRVAIIPK